MHSDTWGVAFHQKMRAKCYCVFSDSEHIHRTSDAKELANSIVAVAQHALVCGRESGGSQTQLDAGLLVSTVWKVLSSRKPG